MTTDGPYNDHRHEQFVGLFARHQLAIFSYILSLLPNWADAEDIFQQTSIVLWRKFDEFDTDDPASDFTRWGCRIAQYKVLNHLKKNRRDRHVFSDDLVNLMATEGIASAGTLDAESRALQSCLGKLQSRHREVLRACYGSVSVKSVAQRLGRTPNSLYKLLNRIRERLLHCIERALRPEMEH